MRRPRALYPGTVRALTLFAIAGSAACAGSDLPSQPGSSPSSQAVSCTPRGSSNGQPITDPNGPYFHQTVLARTTDGLTLENPHQVLDHASVPDGVRRVDGSVLVYYVNGAAASTWVARIVDDTAQVIGPITVGVRVDGSIVDGDCRGPDKERLDVYQISLTGQTNFSLKMTSGFTEGMGIFTSLTSTLRDPDIFGVDSTGTIGGRLFLPAGTYYLAVGADSGGEKWLRFSVQRNRSG